jgi:hypothetical protein
MCQVAPFHTFDIFLSFPYCYHERAAADTERSDSLWAISVFHVKWTKFSTFRSQNETFHMWGQDNKQVWWFKKKIKKVVFFKNSYFKNILNGLWNKTKKKNKIPLRSQNETFHMWGQDNEQFWWFFKIVKKVGFFKKFSFQKYFEWPWNGKFKKIGL